MTMNLRGGLQTPNKFHFTIKVNTLHWIFVCVKATAEKIEEYNHTVYKYTDVHEKA